MAYASGVETVTPPWLVCWKWIGRTYRRKKIILREDSVEENCLEGDITMKPR